MTDEETQIVDKPKAAATEELGHLVGWRLENMWSLAWLLGHVEEPSAITGQLSDDVSGALLALFLPDFSVTADELVARGSTPPIDKVIQMEDLFYLAHNAVRSGQIGETGTLPEGFDPIAEGGAIHERRHALTWALAPGADWDETDLST